MAPRCQVGETDEEGGKTQIALFVSGGGRLLICGPNEILRKSQMRKCFWSSKRAKQRHSDSTKKKKIQLKWL